MPTNVQLGIVSALMLVPFQLPAQLSHEREVAPLKPWAAPLYWQPARGETQAEITRQDALSAAAAGPNAQTPANSLVFVGVTPCRLMDTRTGAGFTGAFGGPIIAGGTTRTVPIPSSPNCTIPSTAQAYSLNVTVVPPAPLGYVTLYPTGLPQPLVSTLNDSQAAVVANAAIVPAGTAGSVNVFVSNTTDLVLDINGYYAPQSGITLAQGTAGAPSLSFAGDAGSGIFSSGAGNIGLATGGVVGLTLASSGYVGIGTTSPHARLDAETSDSSISAVFGGNNATSGYAVGVGGYTASNNGAGVQGNAILPLATGVHGSNSATSGYAVGVQGDTASNNGAGVQGNASVAGAVGVGAFNSATSGYAVAVSAGISGGNGAAVSANASGGGGFGVSAFNSSTSGFAVGVQGVTASPNGPGILGQTMACTGSGGCNFTSGGTGGEFHVSTGGNLLTGYSGAVGTNAFAGNKVFNVDGNGNGFFAGNLLVNGSVTKGGGSFRIDHPLDPENKYLYHSFVESPDMKNIYDGVAVLDENGEAVVTLPDWFEALNQDFRYQLTCIGGYAPVYVGSEVSGNQFRIAGGRPALKVSWMLTGIRHDAYANAHRIPVKSRNRQLAK